MNKIFGLGELGVGYWTRESDYTGEYTEQNKEQSADMQSK